jgi:hypothetical protein
VGKQRHDLGYRKRQAAQPKLPRARLEWLRVKRRHPGPLPLRLRNFAEWLDSGRPRQ